MDNFNLLSFLKRSTNEPILSKERAFVLSKLGKKGKYSDITERFKKYLLHRIEEKAKLGDNYLLVAHPTYATEEAKDEIVQFLKELDYSICFYDEDVMLISWKYDRESK